MHSPDTAQAIFSQVDLALDHGVMNLLCTAAGMVLFKSKVPESEAH